jgi:hypothetical protein
VTGHGNRRERKDRETGEEEEKDRKGDMKQ